MIPLETYEERSTTPHSGLWTAAPDADTRGSRFALDDTRNDAHVPLFAGELVAERYQVIALVGEGGMGHVYRCRDLSNGAYVALKLPIQDLDEESVTHDCFMAETRALARMNHEGIVAVRASGATASGMPYLVMDWVPGVALNRVATRNLEHPLVWSIVDQVLGALNHAHARGIVHGDVKPANVMIETTGAAPRVRLVDFGLAWHFEGTLADAADRRRLVWSPPSGAGTVGYMAPEQALGNSDAVGPCTDLYSLGCLAYRLLTGESPRPWGQRYVCCRSSSANPQLPVPAREKLPARTLQFIRKLLNHDPRDRARSAADARAEWASHRPAGSPPTAERGSSVGENARLLPG